MSLFSSLQNALLTVLRQTPRNTARAFQAYSISLPMPDAPAEWLLRLLAHSAEFPRFFWQNPTRSQQFGAFGAVIAFDSLTQAVQFSQDNSDFTLLGGLRFDKQAHFFLPRLQCRYQAETASLQCTLYAKRDETHEALEREILALKISEPLAPFAPAMLTAKQQAASQTQWQALIAQALEAIDAQAFQKVVLANATKLQFDAPLAPLALLTESLQSQPNCYHFLYQTAPDYAFLGASPERLYARQGALLKTEALAGTVPRHADQKANQQSADWLLNDRKNVQENALVVEDIQAQLCDGVQAFTVESLQIKPANLVQHLHRPIHAHLNATMNDADCLTRLHPTAAVAGLPRQTAIAFIQQNEPFEREWYAGTLGFFNQAQAEFCVTIRSALIQGNQATLYAGAGILAGSDPQAEWREIERKAQGFYQLLCGESA